MELSPGARRWQVTRHGPPVPVPLPQLQAAAQKGALKVPRYLELFLCPAAKKRKGKTNFLVTAVFP